MSGVKNENKNFDDENDINMIDVDQVGPPPVLPPVHPPSLELPTPRAQQRAQHQQQQQQQQQQANPGNEQPYNIEGVNPFEQLHYMQQRFASELYDNQRQLLERLNEFGNGAQSGMRILHEQMQKVQSQAQTNVSSVSAKPPNVTFGWFLFVFAFFCKYTLVSLL